MPRGVPIELFWGELGPSPRAFCLLRSSCVASLSVALLRRGLPRSVVFLEADEGVPSGGRWSNLMTFSMILSFCWGVPILRQLVRLGFSEAVEATLCTVAPTERWRPSFLQHIYTAVCSRWIVKLALALVRSSVVLPRHAAMIRSLAA